MALIALQNNFLPTDTASAVVQPEASFVPFVIAVILILGVIFSSVIAERTGSGKWLLTGLAMSVGIFACLGVLMVPQGEYRASLVEASVEDMSNFVANIEAAYDVEVVLPEDEDYSVSPDKKRPVTAIQDGTAYSALVSQDPYTYEPTLIMVASVASDINEFRKK